MGLRNKSTDPSSNAVLNNAEHILHYNYMQQRAALYIECSKMIEKHFNVLSAGYIYKQCNW